MKKSLDVTNRSPVREDFYTLPTYEDDEIDLYQLWLILKKRLKIIFFITILFATIAVGYILISPPVYKTETTIFPLGSKKVGVSSLLANLPIALPSSTTSSLTVETVLRSRILRERIIEKLNLLPVLYSNLWNSERKTWKENISHIPTVLDGAEKLKKLISVSNDKKSGVIILSVEFPKDPQMAYKIAKTALEETQKILDEKSWSLAKKHRIFIEKQIKEALEKWKLLEEIYSKFIQGKIKEVPLIINESFLNKLLVKNENATTNVGNLNLEGLKKKIKQFSYPTGGNISRYQFNYQKLQWQMRLLQNILTTLFQQYEVAKANEIKEQVAFQIIDPPYVPEKDKPYKPKKVLILAVATVSGVFLGVFFAFFMEWLETTRKKYKTMEAHNNA